LIVAENYNFEYLASHLILSLWDRDPLITLTDFIAESYNFEWLPSQAATLYYALGTEKN
jgi:hypothetical protein